MSDTAPTATADSRAIATARHPLYQAALDADEAYSAAIHTAYGPKATRWTIPDPPSYAVHAAYKAKINADAVWLDYQQDHTKTASTQPYRTTPAAQRIARELDQMADAVRDMEPIDPPGLAEHLPDDDDTPRDLPMTIHDYTDEARRQGYTPPTPAAQRAARVRIQLTCNECGKRWKVSPDSDPQCPACSGVDYEVGA